MTPKIEVQLDYTTPELEVSGVVLIPEKNREFIATVRQQFERHTQLFMQELLFLVRLNFQGVKPKKTVATKRKVVNPQTGWCFYAHGLTLEKISSCFRDFHALAKPEKGQLLHDEWLKRRDALWGDK